LVLLVLLVLSVLFVSGAVAEVLDWAFGEVAEAAPPFEPLGMVVFDELVVDGGAAEVLGCADLVCCARAAAGSASAQAARPERMILSISGVSELSALQNPPDRGSVSREFGRPSPAE
jgi:hypothetical protein